MSEWINKNELSRKDYRKGFKGVLGCLQLEIGEKGRTFISLRHR